MDREQKAAVVDEIAGEIQGADAIFAVDYRGLSVTQAADLRARLREADTKFRIVKNSLSERAADQAGVQELKAMLEGPTALALVRGDAALAAKALNETARALNILEFKGGLMDGSALSADDVRAIARLPAREVLHAQLVGTIASPISGLVRGLNALLAGLAVQLQAIADQGLVTGQAPPTEADAAAEPAPETEAESPLETEAAAQPEAENPPEPEAETPPEPEAETPPEPEAETPPDQSEQTESQDAPDAESSGA